MMLADAACPCCSGLNFNECCEQIIANKTHAATPLQLMRSRYTAHVCKNMPHIKRTMRGKALKLFDEEKTKSEWFDQCIWKQLEILDAPEVGKYDKTGVVEFKAHFDFKGKTESLHERSKFQKIDNEWYYIGMQNKNAYIETSEKVGRNDECPCGSGKKYKKCCAVSAQDIW